MNHLAKITSKVVAIGVIPIIAISVVLGIYLSSIPSNSGSYTVSSTITSLNSSSTSSQSSTSATTNLTQNTTITTTVPSAQNFSLSIPYSQLSEYALNKTWEFSVFAYVNQNTVDLNSTLTYLSNRTEEFEIQHPINTILVVNQNGTGVWSWAVPGALALVNVTEGEEFIDFNQIPTSVMEAPGSYIITILPLLNSINGTSLGQLLEVNMTIFSSHTGTTSWITTTSGTSTTSSSQNPVLTSNEAFSYDKIPSRTIVGNFTIQFSNPNGHIMSGNGSQYMFIFNITTPDGVSGSVPFVWTPPCSLNLGFRCESDNSWVLPDPENATVNYLDANLLILWYTNTTGFYLSFQEWDNIQTTSTTTTISNSISNSIILDNSNGSAACESLMPGSGTAKWEANTCMLTGSETTSPSFLVSPNTILDIFPGITLVLDNPGFGFENYGTIINNGTIDLKNTFGQEGIIDNYGLISANATFVSDNNTNFMPSGGTVNNYGAFEIIGYYANYPANSSDPNQTAYLAGGNFGNGAIFNNYGSLNNSGVIQNFVIGANFNSTINNYGTLQNLPGSEFQNRDIVNNNGTIINAGDFVNNGTVVNFCGSNFLGASGGTYLGNPIIGACGTTITQIMTTTETESSSP